MDRRELVKEGEGAAKKRRGAMLGTERLDMSRIVAQLLRLGAWPLLPLGTLALQPECLNEESLSMTQLRQQHKG